MTSTVMTREQAKKLAKTLKKNCDRMPMDAGDGPESKAWDVALSVLLAWAREISSDIKTSRELLALSSFLVGNNKRRKEIHDSALRLPELALKCSQCGENQDTSAMTCDEDKRHADACGNCGECPDCSNCELWVRPGKEEALVGSRWEVLPPDKLEYQITED